MYATGGTKSRWALVSRPSRRGGSVSRSSKRTARRIRGSEREGRERGAGETRERGEQLQHSRGGERRERERDRAKGRKDGRCRTLSTSRKNSIPRRWRHFALPAKPARWAVLDVVRPPAPPKGARRPPRRWHLEHDGGEPAARYESTAGLLRVRRAGREESACPTPYRAAPSPCHFKLPAWTGLRGGVRPLPPAPERLVERPTY